jgi:hypothetical protein
MRVQSLLCVFAPLVLVAGAVAIDHTHVAEHLRRDVCENYESGLVRRDGVGVGGDVNADVTVRVLPPPPPYPMFLHVSN